MSVTVPEGRGSASTTMPMIVPPTVVSRHEEDVRWTSLARRSVAAGTAGGLAMMPIAAVLKRGLGREINVYGELVAQAVVGRADVWVLALQHFAISWALAVPLAALSVRQRSTALVVGLAYGGLIWFSINSLALPWIFGRPTPWWIGWSAIWPSLILHLVYGAVTATCFASIAEAAATRARESVA